MIRCLIVLSILMPLVLLPSLSRAQDARTRLQSVGYEISHSSQFVSVTSQVESKIGKMTTSLLKPDEKSSKVEVVLLDQPQTELLVVKEPGKFTVAISEGLLQNFKNDDQLAILLADGLTHPEPMPTEKKLNYFERWCHRDETKLEDVFKRVHDGGWSPREYRELGPVIAPYVYKPGSDLAMFIPKVDYQVRKLDIALNHAKFAQGNVIQTESRHELVKLAQDQWLKTKGYHTEREDHLGKLIEKMNPTDLESDLTLAMKGEKLSRARPISMIVDDRFRIISRNLSSSTSDQEREAWRGRVERKTISDLNEVIGRKLEKHPDVNQLEAISHYIRSGQADSKNPAGYKDLVSVVTTHRSQNAVSPLAEAAQKAASTVKENSERGIAQIAALKGAERDQAVERALALRAENFIQATENEEDSISKVISITDLFTSKETESLLHQHSNPQAMYDILFRKYLPHFENEFGPDLGKINIAGQNHKFIQSVFQKTVAKENPLKLSKETTEFLMDFYVQHLDLTFKAEGRRAASSSLINTFKVPSGVPDDLVKRHQAALRKTLDQLFEMRRDEFAKEGFEYTRNHQLAEIAWHFDGLKSLYPEVKSVKPADLWKAEKELYLLEKSPDRRPLALSRLLEDAGDSVPRSEIVQTLAKREYGYFAGGSNPTFAAAAKQMETEIKEAKAKPAFPKTISELVDKWPRSTEDKTAHRAALQKMILERSQDLRKKHPGDLVTFAQKLFEGLNDYKVRDETAGLLKFLARNGVIPKEPRDRLQFFMGALDDFRTDDFGRGLKIESLTMNILGEKKGRVDFSKFRPEDLVPVYERLSSYNRSSALQDQLYVHLKDVTKKDPNFKFTPKIKTILDDRLRKEAVLEIMQKELPGLRDPKQVRVAGEKDLRNQVLTMHEILDNHLADDDIIRNDLIEVFEKKYRTDFDESRIVNVVASKGKGLPHTYAPGTYVNAIVESDEDTYQILRYLFGKDPRAFPAAVKTADMHETGKQLSRQHLQDFYAKFHSVGAPERALMLQHLLGGKNGLLKNPQMRERVEKMILGQYADNKVVSRLLRDYLANQLPEDREITYGKFLSSLADGKGKGELQLGTILDSMYAFGDRAKQGFAVSPWLNRELRDSMSESFTNSRPPTRQEMFEYLTNIFGRDKVKHIIGEPELVGSGSVNFVLKVKMKHPVTGELTTVALRIQKAGVEGQVRNQNEIWRKGTEGMLRDSDPEIRKAGAYIDEVRSYAVKSLLDGGPDLDQAQERAQAGRAHAAYAAPADSKTGFRIDVVKPLEDFQKAYIPEEYSKKVSVYEFVEHVPLSEIDPKLRKSLIAQALDAELNGVFVAGEFDSEPHPGNWMFDLKNKRLVRTDTANFTKISSENRLALKNVFAVLMQPKPSATEIETLVRDFPTLFADRTALKTLKPEELRDLLQKTMSDGKFPEFSDPAERLVRLRQALEENVGGRTGKFQPLSFNHDIQSAFSNLQKTSRYRDYLSPVEIAKAMMAKLDVSASQMAGSFVRSKLCIKGFSDLGGKK